MLRGMVFYGSSQHSVVVANHAWMPPAAEDLNLIATKTVLWATFAVILYV